MIYLRLFFSFIKIGFSSFGGLSLVPVINQEMMTNGWMTAQEVQDIIAIAEMTPGSLGINCATFAGMRVAGLAGGAAATLGVMMPSLTLCLIAAIFVEKFRKSRTMEDILHSVRPICLGMIAATALTLMQTNFLPSGIFCWQALVIAVIAGVVLMKFKANIPIVVLLSAGLGLLLVR